MECLQPCHAMRMHYRKKYEKKNKLHDKHTLSISLFLYLKKEVTPQTSKSLFPPEKLFEEYCQDSLHVPSKGEGHCSSKVTKDPTLK